LRKGREVEFVTGDALRKQRATDMQKKWSLHFTESITTKSAVM